MNLNRLKRWLYGIKVYIHKRAIKRFSFCHGVLGPCFHIGKRRRQNTAYAQDESNWVFLCDECNIINEEHWAERWQEYYSSILCI